MILNLVLAELQLLSACCEIRDQRVKANPEVTSSMSTDEGEGKRKKKGKKLVRNKDRKRERKGKGMHGEMLPSYTICNIT